MGQTEKKQAILITGATGFIGHLLVKKIVESKKEITLVLPVRNIEKAKEMYAQEIISSEIDIRLIATSVETFSLNICDIRVDYIIHCASVTKSAEMISNPVEVADGIILGTRSILEFARTNPVKSFVYISSMEVYGKVIDTGNVLSEEELGDISLTSIRSCYSLGKRMAEHYCHIYYHEYDVPVKIARLAQTFGKGIHKTDNRIFAQFARAVIDERDIVLKTTGMSVGNYCETEDAMRAIFTILIKGINGETYNIVNEANTMRIKEMAEMVATQISKGRIEVRCEAENPIKYGYAPETGLRLSSQKLRKLGWRPTKKLEEMYRDLIEELQSDR